MIILAHLTQTVIHLGDIMVEVTSGYTYLAVYKKYNGNNMLSGIIRLKQQANHAMYCVLVVTALRETRSWY